jgi:hypothetical protein
MRNALTNVRFWKQGGHIDGGLEIDDPFEDAALEAPLGEDGEETLDGVEPTSLESDSRRPYACYACPRIPVDWPTSIKWPSGSFM